MLQYWRSRLEVLSWQDWGEVLMFEGIPEHDAALLMRRRREWQLQWFCEVVEQQQGFGGVT